MNLPTKKEVIETIKGDIQIALIIFAWTASAVFALFLAVSGFIYLSIALQALNLAIFIQIIRSR